MASRFFVAKSHTKVNLEQNLEYGKPTKMKGSFPWILCPATYNDNGVKKQLYFQTPKQMIWGLKPHDFPNGGGLKEYRVSFPTTSLETVECPTNDEQTFIDYMQTCHDHAWKYLQLLAKQSKEDLASMGIPKAFAGAMKNAKEEGREYAMKPWKMAGISKDPNASKDDKKAWVLDPSKPERMLIRLASDSGVKNMYCNIYFPGNVKRPYTDILDRSGMAQLLLKFDGIFIGTHGSDLTWVAALRFGVQEMNFTPKAVTGIRMIDANNDEPEEEEVHQRQNMDNDGEVDETPSAWNGKSPMDSDNEDTSAFNPVLAKKYESEIDMAKPKKKKKHRREE